MMNWEGMIALVSAAVAVTSIFWRNIRPASRFVTFELYEANRAADMLRMDALHTHYVEIKQMLVLMQKDIASIIERNKLIDKGWTAPEEKK